MNKIIMSVLAAGALALAGCTDNVRAKHWGGKLTINLPFNQKLVNATWKDGNLWYLTRQMRSNETAEVSLFKEDSNFGVLNGEVLFIEKK